MNSPRVRRLRVLLADDNPGFRGTLLDILKVHRRFEVIGQAASLEETVTKMRLLSPDIVLIATNLPDGAASQAAKAILAERPNCKVIVLAGHCDDEALFAAIRSGARGYLLRNMPAASLLAALDAIWDGEMLLFGSEGSRGGYSDLPASHRRESALDRLTRHELQVLEEMSMGASNQEIAHRLRVPLSAVNSHVNHILSKLEVSGPREAARMAVRSGLRGK